MFPIIINVNLELSHSGPRRILGLWKCGLPKATRWRSLVRFPNPLLKVRRGPCLAKPNLSQFDSNTNRISVDRIDWFDPSTITDLRHGHGMFAKWNLCQSYHKEKKQTLAHAIATFVNMLRLWRAPWSSHKAPINVTSATWAADAEKVWNADSGVCGVGVGRIDLN